MKGPNQALAVARYRAQAQRYDDITRRMEPVRQRAIDALQLRVGDTVLDVACGTGKSFPLLQQCIGTQGRIIAIDQSPDMLEIARQRVRQNGWDNVTLIEAAMEHARIPAEVDAILFNYTHDVLRSRAALDNVFSAAKCGTRVVSAGMKHFPRWLAPLNPIVWLKAWRYTTTLEGFDRPWDLLTCYVDGIEIQSMYLGIAYVARAVHRPPLEYAARSLPGRIAA